ncbi:hypothetical protein TcasGA2_TC033625 [Tribolium castaneum]|uniref:Uncharacterized protein n=1 Tax=Tribolium castaneum TaxID=7070 RepID=A0A139WFD7_TRICA|nr:hypothetical protein TcasGA2_TC033625 [Tribolium castaneum]
MQIEDLCSVRGIRSRSGSIPCDPSRDMFLITIKGLDIVEAVEELRWHSFQPAIDVSPRSDSTWPNTARNKSLISIFLTLSALSKLAIGLLVNFEADFHPSNYEKDPGEVNRKITQTINKLESPLNTPKSMFLI